MESLPATDDGMLDQAQREYEAEFKTGTDRALYHAKIRLVWALVHHPSCSKASQGVSLAQELLEQHGPDRELLYLKAVGLFKQQKNVLARKELVSLLQSYPEFRQAEMLKGLVDDAIVNDGLIGMGVVAGLFGLAGLAAVAVLRGVPSR